MRPFRVSAASTSVTILDEEGATRIGSGEFKPEPRLLGGYHSGQLRPDSPLPPGHYVLDFGNQTLWSVRTSERSGMRFGPFGGWVRVVSDGPPPAA